MSLSFDALATSIIANVIVGMVSFSAGRYWIRLKEKKKLDHLSFITSTGRLRIALPQLKVEYWELEELQTKSIQPPNVPLMPMAEGAAIARLISAIHRYKGACQIDFFTSNGAASDSVPIVSIGGPSVNPVSKTIISEHFPNFKLIYPEHRAKLGSLEFIPEFQPDGSLKDDYGFIFVVPNEGGENMVVLCGVWGTGTEMAARAFIDLKMNKEAAELLRLRRKCLFVAKGIVRDFSATNVSIFLTDQAA